MRKPMKYQRKALQTARESDWAQLVAGEGIRQRTKRNKQYFKAMDKNIKYYNRKGV